MLGDIDYHGHGNTVGRQVIGLVAYHLTGDGVAVPVVSYIAKQILEPNLASMRSALDQSTEKAN